jgi:hypothetical protein
MQGCSNWLTSLLLLIWQKLNNSGGQEIKRQSMLLCQGNKLITLQPL